MTKKTYEYGRELASAIIQEAGRLEKQATMTHEETQAHLIAWGEQSARLAKRRQDFLRDHPGDQAARHAVNIAQAADKHIDSVFDSVRAMQSRQDSLRGTPGEHLHGEDDHPEYDTGLSESAHAKIGRVRRAAGIRRSLATHIADNSRFYGRVAAGVGGAAIGGLALGGAYGAKRYADHAAESKTLVGRAKKGLSEVRKAIGRNPKLALGLGAGTLAVGGAGVALHEHQKKAALFVDLVDGGYSLAEAASLIKQASDDNKKRHGAAAAFAVPAVMAAAGSYGAGRYARRMAESKTFRTRAKKGLSELRKALKHNPKLSIRKAIEDNPKLALGFGVGGLAAGVAGTALHEHQKKAALFVDLVDGGYSLAEAASLIKQASR